MSDEKYMRRALELAQLGLGKVSPNPMVGCVIVHNHKIIGEGYHQKFGESHAEVNAINSVKDQALIRDSEAYVSLEPCAHYGKTPPCVDLLIERGIRKVIVASLDPNRKVDGKGLQKLKENGVDTEEGVMTNEANELNRRFISYHINQQPYVILKWAQTKDGFIAKENNDSKWISNEISRQIVHKWRTEEDAILVGKHTAIHDNPSLTARKWKGENPIRILLDTHLEVNEQSSLFDKDAKTIIFNSKEEKEVDNIKWIKLPSLTPTEILETLFNLNIQSVIIEGGTKTLNSFIQANCWNEARVFTSTKKFGKGVTAPIIEGKLIEELSFESDQLKIIRNNGR